jgi:hypothetical protein
MEQRRKIYESKNFGDFRPERGRNWTGCNADVGARRSAFEADSIKTLTRAAELGVTLWDTADAYCISDKETGHNERLLAKPKPRCPPICASAWSLPQKAVISGPKAAGKPTVARTFARRSGRQPEGSGHRLH